MRYVLSLSVCFVFSVAALADSNPTNKKAFTEAYKAYQTAEVSGSVAARIETSERAYELGKTVYKNDPATLAILAQNYGLEETNPDKATPALKHVIDLLENLHGRSSSELITPLTDLAKIQNQQRKGFVFNKALKRAESILLENYDGTSAEAGRFYLEVGQIALLNRSNSAPKYLEKAVTILELPQNSEAQFDLAHARFWLGKYQLARGQLAKAKDNLLFSLVEFEEQNPSSQLTMANHAQMISLYERQNMRDEATKHCQAIGKAQPENSDQNYLPVYLKTAKYPVGKTAKGKEGYAVIELTVDKEGFVINPKVTAVEGGYAFGQAALKAVRDFRYIPRFKNGEPVDTEGVKYKFSFGTRS